VRNLTNLPDLAVEQILVWADAHRRRTGDWPRAASGPIPEAPGETWQIVESALREGARGLEGGSSLARLLQQHRGLRNPKNLPPLSEKQIVAWAKAHRDRTGRRPSAQSGPILEAPGETWERVDTALRDGSRGLPKRSTLAQLLNDHGLKRPGACQDRPVP